MRKIIVLILCCAVVFSVSTISVFANEGKPEISVTVSGSSSSGIDMFNFYGKGLPVVGKKNNVGISFKGFDSFSYGKMTLKYNAENISVLGISIPCDVVYDGWESLYEVPRDYIAVSKINEGNGFAEYEFVADGREFDSVTICVAEIEIIEKGSFDLEVEFAELKDKDGNPIDATVQFALKPEYTHYEDEIPENPVLDQTNSLTYGISLTMAHVKTELAYPMTVGEFIDSVDCNGGYGVIVDYYGNELSRNDFVPTGAKFINYFDNVKLFETTITVIGDVTLDGKITAADARLILRIAAGLETYRYGVIGTLIKNAANTCQSTEITARDARSVMRYAASIEDCYTEWYRYHCLLNKYSRGLYNTNL